MEEFSEKIMTTKFHSLAEATCTCKQQKFCELDNCSDQDLRDLRCYHGKTSFGDKSILKCSKCDKTYSSSDLLNMEVSEKTSTWPAGGSSDINIFDQDDDLFQPTASLSRKKAQIEIYNMNQVMEQKEGGVPAIPPLASDKHNLNHFFISALKNCHNEDHCTSCFKKGHECRMKLPKKPSDKDTVTFATKPTPWYSWKGERQERNLYTLEKKREHVDAFVNTHNEPASVLFGCNTNVVSCVDGENYDVNA